MGGALLWVSCGGWGIILGGWGWVDLSWTGTLFWVNGTGWGGVWALFWVGKSKWKWVGHYCGWVVVGGALFWVDGSGWMWVNILYILWCNASHLILFWLLFMEAAGLFFLLTWNFSKAFFWEKKLVMYFWK